MKLKHWLYGILLAVSMIPLLLCSFIMLHQNNRNIETVVEESLLGISEAQIGEIESFFEQVKQDLEIVSHYSFLQEAVLESCDGVEDIGTSTRQHMEELVKERKNYQPYIETMTIIDKNLNVVVASDDYVAGAASGVKVTDLKYLSGEFRIGDAYTRETGSGKKQLVLAYQGIYYEDELIGYILEEIITDYFNQYHEGNVFWNNGVMKIKDGNSEVITSGGYSEEAKLVALQSKHDSRVEREWNLNPGASSGSLEYKLNGTKYVTCYSVLKYTDWTIRVTANVDGYYETGFTYILLFVAIIIMSFVILTIVNFVITKRVMSPIEKMRKTLQEVQEKQDYSIHIETTSDNELGELQHEINHLLQCVLLAQMQDKQEQEYLEKKAEKDPMTGIMNKKAIAQCIQQMVDDVGKRDGKLAVGFLDIDNFRDYNTKYGHAEGDHVIKFVAHTLREMIPGVVGRNGGDEFVFCLETDERELVEQVIHRLTRRLSDGVINTVTNEQMSIPCSIGIVIDKAENTDCRKLIQEADEAMYQAKGNGKNTYHIIMK